MVEEVENGLETEMSILNECYSSNSVTVLNEDTKTISIKLQKKNKHINQFTEEVLSDWEKRSDPYWKNWAGKMRRCLENQKKIKNVSPSPFYIDHSYKIDV